ncbi:MAG: hypothetical protein H6707_21120 [Deltaproteobacteria bacterium]|nr:hypothetical protein [Deltaproteobacteria bacterium]
MDPKPTKPSTPPPLPGELFYVTTGDFELDALETALTVDEVKADGAKADGAKADGAKADKNTRGPLAV